MSRLQRLATKTVRRLLGIHVGPRANTVIDHLIAPVRFSDLGQLSGCRIETIELDLARYKSWIRRHFKFQLAKRGDFRHKKFTEFFVTFSLLEPGPHDVVMDAGAGSQGYLSFVESKQRILQDVAISLKTRRRLRGVDFVQCDAGNISVQDRTVDKISCHHSFEHFRGDSDTGFIREVQRILKPGGRCCIVTIFIADNYVEITDSPSFDLKFDERSKRVIDLTATIAGGEFSGNYARVYDLEAFQRRVLDHIDKTRFRASLFELRVGEQLWPDLSLPCHLTITSVECPYRVLLIEHRSASS